MMVIHATCVAIDGAGVLLRGPSGSGKSDLALRLIDAGAALVADDGCALTVRQNFIYAAPPPTIAGRMEVRGHGIIFLPYQTDVPLRLVADLKPKADIERLPDDATCQLEGVRVPRMFVDPELQSAEAKIRVVLRSLFHRSTAMAAKS